MNQPARALVRRPSPRLADGITTHIERHPVDVGLAVTQWRDYVEVLAGAGWDTIEVAPVEQCLSVRLRHPAGARA